MSPAGIVARIEGAREASAAIKSRSSALSTETSSKRTGSPTKRGGSLASTARVATFSIPARSISLASASSASNCASVAAIASPAPPSARKSSIAMSFHRSSSSVRASAREKPGRFSTGAKCASAPEGARRKTARAATASAASPSAGARPASASVSAASNPTRRFNVRRCTPSIAPRDSANARTKSSAASLTDAITRTSLATGCDSSHARAAVIRSLARSEIIISREAGIRAARLDAAPHHYRRPRRSYLARGRAAVFPQQ